MTNQIHFQARTAEELLEGLEKRLMLVKQAANESSAASYDRKYRAVIDACVSWFNATPLSPHIYREAGGAIRATVETAFYAMRLAGGQKFGSTLPSEVRRRVEPQYTYGVFLAAVCSYLDEPHRHFSVIRLSDGVEWMPLTDTGMAAWLEGSPFQLRLRPQPLAIERMRTAMLAQRVIGASLLAQLDTPVQSEMFGAINPVTKPSGGESLLHKVVRQAVSVASDFDLKAQAAVFAPVAATIPDAAEVESGGAKNAARAPESSAAAATAPKNEAEPSAPAPIESALIKEAPKSIVLSGARSPKVSANGELFPAEGSNPNVDLLNATIAPAPAVFSPAQMGASRVPVAAPPRSDVLHGMPAMIQELFRALREDIDAGKAKVSWSEKGLVLSKRLIGGYGVASDTLVEHLRKKSLVVGNSSSEVVLAPDAGVVLLEREAKEGE